MIAIIDYGLGNIKAFANVYKNLGVEHTIASKPELLERATKLILPGVGSFDHAMNLLNNSGMRDVLEKLVIGEKIPVLGICVGMQMLAKSSEEGEEDGLGWINAEVNLFDVKKIPYKTTLPHMGWNIVEMEGENQLLKSLEKNPRFYFLHSYYFNCNDSSNSISRTNYGDYFTSAVNMNNIYGVQFHPEKSHHNGVQVLKNFGLL